MVSGGYSYGQGGRCEPFAYNFIGLYLSYNFIGLYLSYFDFCKYMSQEEVINRLGNDIDRDILESGQFVGYLF